MTDQALHSKAFSQAIAEDLLIGSHCLACGNISIPQCQIDPNCHSDQVEPIQTNGQETLAAFTMIYISPTSMVDASYHTKNLYCVGLELSDPASSRIGMPLKLTCV